MKVEIKVRMLTGGNRSLYLEYYETGFRKRENLHLYLVPDDAPNARKLNEQTYLPKGTGDTSTAHPYSSVF